jgi:hypothetical protein
MSRTAFGDVTFCDDIRNEVGGKITLVGVYPHVMYVHSDFPATLPKLGLLIKYSERLDAPRENVELMVFLPGELEPTVRGTLPIQELTTSSDTSEFEAPESELPHYAHVGVQVVFSPLLLKQQGSIIVRAVRAGEEIRLGRLSILRAKPKT